ALATSQDVAGRDLSLALGNDPVLDADALPRVRIGPSRDVAGGEDAGDARLEEFVDEDAVVGREPGLLRDRDRRPHADAHHDAIGIERPAAAERDAASRDRR